MKMNMTGYLTMDGTDVWTAYKAFLCEQEGEHKNLDALLRMPKAKDVTTVDFRERNGVDLPQDPDLKLSSIERTLQFAIIAASEAERLSLYQNFLSALLTGVKSFAVKGYRTYRLLYRDMPSDPAWYNDYGQGKFVVIFSVKFLEANPALNTD